MQPFLMKYWLSSFLGRPYRILQNPCGMFLESPGDFLAPQSHFLVNRYRITENCIHLKLVIWGEPLFKYKNMSIKQLWSHAKTFRDLRETGPWSVIFLPMAIWCRIKFRFPSRGVFPCKKMWRVYRWFCSCFFSYMKNKHKNYDQLNELSELFKKHKKFLRGLPRGR